MEAPEMPVMPEVVEPPKKKTNVWLIVIIVLVVLCCCCVIAGFAGFKMFGTQINDIINSISNQVY
jgi:hypothetical protein